MSEQVSKKLVVYYSFEGNTKFIGETVAEEIGAELLVLKPKSEISSRGFMKYFLGGKQVILKQSPKLEGFPNNFSNYDLIFIGTPVWAWNYAPPLRSFFAQVRLTGKKIALFCCSGGSKGKTFEEMKKELKENKLLGEKEFIEPLKNDKEENEKIARKWAREIVALL